MPATKKNTQISKPRNFPVLQAPDVLVSKSTGKAVPIHVIRTNGFDAWIKSQPKAILSSLTAQGFKAVNNSVGITYVGDKLDAVYVCVGEQISLYAFAAVAEHIIKSVSEKLSDQIFALEDKNLSEKDLEQISVGWSLAAYKFDAYKKNTKKYPKLLWSKRADKNRIEALIQSISLIRNLINLPPNALGPAELADAAKQVAAAKKATIKITEDKKLLTANFPMIYAVGDSSERRPRLIDITWGKASDPKLTLVGKGVVFDTGGLDIKPSSAMLLMKKDMGGSAMVLGLAWMIISLNLPVRLRVLIPAVENSISGIAYRPGDILTSRQGLTVEIGNTDAEGRLVMADCLTLACEEKPDLLIDFSTLTGAARSALGFELPAMFSNNDNIGAELQRISMSVEDPVWQMPLWQPYKNDIMSPVADINNAGNNPAGAITAALFLEHFITNNTDWVHIDHYAWEQSGRPGRPKGGADMAMRATLAYLEKRYAKKKTAGRKK